MKKLGGPLHIQSELQTLDLTNPITIKCLYA